MGSRRHDAANRSQQWTNDGCASSDTASLTSLQASLIVHLYPTALFASKEGAAKVQLRVAASALPSAATPEEEVFNFHFTAGASAVSDREHFKKELSAIIAANRDRDAAPPPPAVPLPSATTAAGDKGKGKERVGTPGANPNASNAVEIRLRKLVLQAHPQLMSLHRDLVMSRQITEAEFWEGREDLIEAAKAAEAQLKGKSGEMVDPRPETSESGEVTVKITPALIADIFAEYPAVLKAYTDNVPDPVSRSSACELSARIPLQACSCMRRLLQLDEQEFWTRYFQSKLFNRNRTANRAAVSTIKDDKIFDLYLGEEDDGAAVSLKTRRSSSDKQCYSYRYRAEESQGASDLPTARPRCD